jgi:hypothetical protein
MSLVVVKDITITEENLMADMKSKDGLGKYAALAMGLGIDITPFVPKHVKHNVSFGFHGPGSIASGLRRGLVSECPILSMLNDFTKTKHDDEHLLVDALQTAIEGIPINQEITGYDDWTISLDVRNTLPTKRWILSGEIVVKDGKGKLVDDLFEKMIPLTQLKPGRFIQTPITLGIGIGNKNGNAFKPCGIVRYKDLNLENKHVLEYEPTDFIIGYQTFGNTDDPLYLIKTVCKDIIRRVEKTQELIRELKSNDDVMGDMLQFSKLAHAYKYDFLGETRTVTHMYAQYIALTVSGIFVTCGEEHPLDDSSFVKINHPSSHQIMLDAGEKIIADVKTILDAFNHHRYRSSS